MSSRIAEAPDAASSLRERKRVLDDGWLLMLLSIVAALSIPWFLRNFQVDLAPVTWLIFAYGVAYLVLSSALDRLRAPRVKVIALSAMQVGAVVFLAFLWHLAGNLQNPMFLLAFALPVVAAGCALPGARPGILAAIAVACVTLVALVNAPQLRWYVGQLGIPVDRFPVALAHAAAQPFPGLDMPASYLFLMLVTFSVLLFAVALLSHSVALLVRDLQGRLDASARALTDAHTLAAEVIRVAAKPTALVYTDTLNVAQASASFLQRMELLPESLQEKNLLGLVDFDYPEVVAEMIAAQGGEVPVALYRVGGVEHLARIHIARVDHAGARYACVTLDDIGEGLVSAATLDASTLAFVVIGPDGKICAFNAAARGSLPGIQRGVDAALALGDPATAEGWWVLGPRGQRSRTVPLAGKEWEAHCIAVNLFGMAGRLTVVQLRALRQ